MFTKTWWAQAPRLGAWTDRDREIIGPFMERRGRQQREGEEQLLGEGYCGPGQDPSLQNNSRKERAHNNTYTDRYSVVIISFHKRKLRGREARGLLPRSLGL